MKKVNIFRGVHLVPLTWILLALGSCSIVNTVNDNSIMLFTLDVKGQPNDQCRTFVRTIRVNHAKPSVPAVDLAKLTPEEVNDIMMTYLEKLKHYSDNEERFMQEDIARFNLQCAGNQSDVFQN